MIKPVLSYTVGNLLNVVAMLLLLPALISLSSQDGFLTAQGMLVAQVVSIFGAYTFSVTVPRAMQNLKEELKQILIFELLIFQLFIGFLGLGIIYFFYYKNLFMQLFCGFCISYSAAMQWQWFHIAKRNFLLQAQLIVLTRIILICIESLVLVGSHLSYDELFLLLPVMTVLFCAPTIPTFLNLNLKALKKNFIKVNFGLLIYREITKSRHLFFASLFTSIYSLGPSLIIAYVNPSLLVFIQQFDRVRLAISGLSGMLLNAIYPFLLNISIYKLMGGFKRVQKYILIPIFLINLILLLGLILIPFDSSEFLNKLQISYISMVFALIAGFFAASSNAISMTFIHPLKKDRVYLRVIFSGALIFLMSAFISYVFFPISLIGQCLMISMILAETAIFILFWYKCVALFNEYNFKSI